MARDSSSPYQLVGANCSEIGLYFLEIFKFDIFRKTLLGPSLIKPDLRKIRRVELVECHRIDKHQS